MSWRETAERRWAERTSPLAPDLVEVTVSAQTAIPCPARDVWAFVWDPASSVLVSDNVVRGFTMPGTPEGEIGEVQVTVTRIAPGGGLVGLLHEVVELEPGRRAVTRSLSMEHTHYGATEVLPVGEDSCVLRVTFRSPVLRGTEGAETDNAQRAADEYVHRVKDVLTA